MNLLTLPGAGEASGDANGVTRDGVATAAKPAAVQPELPSPAHSLTHGPGPTSVQLQRALAQLPAIDRLLLDQYLASLAQRDGVAFVKRAAKEDLRAQRERTRAGHGAPDSAGLAAAIGERVAELTVPRLKSVINLTGVVIHTNLGRAILGEEAIAAVATAMRNYSALEFDLDDGERGDRDQIVEGLLRELTGAPAATVVNNNAAAVVLALAALAARREVILSRGQLIEIGGSFRLPEIMTTAGCKLVEVGTTNRTHARDYEAALGARTGLIASAHRSNFAVTGFTADVDDATLAAIAHKHGVPYLIDLGSGALIDLAQFGLPREPLPQDALRAGADVVTFSGDKLLGGPQAGIIVGTVAAIARIKKHPLKRALRLSKITLAALEATLRIYASSHRLQERLPTLALLTRSAHDIEATCARVLPCFTRFAGAAFTARTATCQSQIGSGSLPVERLASHAALLTPAASKGGGRAR